MAPEESIPLSKTKDTDRRWYGKERADFLPERFVDVRTHVWLDRFRRVSRAVRGVTPWVCGDTMSGVEPSRHFL